MDELFCAALAVALSSLGCGSSPPSAAAPSAPPLQTPSALPTSSAAAPPTGALEARILTVAISMEDAKLRRVRVEFRNGTSRECKVTQYEVAWPGGKKPARPDVAVPAGQSRDRWLRVDALDGDLSALTADVAKVTLQSDCPVKSP